MAVLNVPDIDAVSSTVAGGRRAVPGQSECRDAVAYAALSDENRRMTKNPWLDIPLADYEGHMALPQIAQAALLADLFELVLKTYLPESVAVLGCAGGNGFDRIDPIVTGRVVGIDINPNYITAAAGRWREHLPNLELLVADIAAEPVAFEPVEMIYAALVFEYIDLAAGLRFVSSRLRPGGRLCTVVQLPSAAIPEITPSKFTTLGALSSIMRLVTPEELRAVAFRHGLHVVEDQVRELPPGKRFQMQVFQRR